MNNDAIKNCSLDVEQLNLHYITVAQRLLRENRAAAMLMLGMSAEAAELVQSLSTQATLKLAKSNFMLCAFRLNELPVARLLRDAKTPSLRETHAAIVLASRKAPALPLAA